MPRVKDAHARAILEGQLGRLLGHPNIVAGFGTFSGAFPHGRLCIPGSTLAANGPDRNVTLLLQELCNRGTLRAALQSGALYAGSDAATAATGDAADVAAGAPLRQLKVLAQAARQVAFGLSHMHAYHVVHCDLNASNVFLQAVAPESGAEDSLDVSLKIGDLGIACIIPPGKDATEHSRSGVLHGTISHMPPEALGADHTVSRATDIWSFGMLLWELWTRSVPFDGLTPQAVVGKVLAHDLPQWPPKTPAVLEQIAGRCWSREAAERPDAYTLAATFAKLAAVLQEADADQLSKGGSAALDPRVPASASPFRPHARAKAHPLPEEDLEDALLAGTLDVALLETPTATTASTNESEERPRLEECEPPGDDKVAQLLWAMLHVPELEACHEVQVSPLRSIVIAPLPYINNHRYIENPLLI